MPIQHLLQDRVRALQHLREAEKKRQRLSYLPRLTRELDRATTRLNELQEKRRLWSDVYQQPTFPPDKEMEQALHKPLQRISNSEDVFEVAVEELDSFQDEVRTATESLDKWDQQLERKLDSFRADCLETVETTRALLRIPDLFEDSDERHNAQALIDGVEELLSIQRVASEQIGELARRWDALWEAFQETRNYLSLDALRERFNLSAETVSLLSRLVEGNIVWLTDASISSLKELKRFLHFAAEISLRLESRTE